MAASRPTIATPKRRMRFLATLAECGNVSRAALASGMSRDAVYDLRQRDADFAASWTDALEQASDRLEQEAWRRAHDGVEEPLTCAKGLIYDELGNPVVVRKYSDTLLIFLLKGARPEKYRENVKISGSVAHSLVPAGEARQLADELLSAVQDMPDARAALSAKLLGDGSGGDAD